MECSNLVEAALKAGNISKSLCQGTTDKELTTDLQRMLFELGFQKELQWDSYQADGDYGPATAAAVSAFAKKNKVESDGSEITDKLAKLLLERHDFLPVMYILSTIHASDFRTKINISSRSKLGITAIQTLLNEMGYGKQLQYAKYGADGIYGNSSRKAFIAYCKDNDIESDGELMTRPVCDLMMRDINAFYGRDWSDLAKNNLPDENSPLILFQGSRFRGQPCRADIEFKPMLEKINNYAEQADVHVHVTSSFRTTTNVRGAIVPPAKFSNHLAGHGIDMNVIYDNGKWADSTVLFGYPDVPEPVRKFIKSIIDDPDLRWGGQFNRKDPVHIDDGLNGKDRAKWKRRYMAMQKAVQLGL